MIIYIYMHIYCVVEPYNYSSKVALLLGTATLEQHLDGEFHQ